MVNELEILAIQSKQKHNLGQAKYYYEEVKRLILALLIMYVKIPLENLTISSNK